MITGLVLTVDLSLAMQLRPKHKTRDMILSVLMSELIFYTSLNIILVPYEVLKTYILVDTFVKTVIGFLL